MRSLFSQASSFALLDKDQMGVWESLDCLNELREYESAMVSSHSHLLYVAADACTHRLLYV